MFSWEVGRVNFYWETHEIQSPRQWGIKKLQTTEQVYKLYSFSNISHVFHLFLRALGLLWEKLNWINFSPASDVFLGRSEGSTFTEKLMKFNPQVNEELKNFKQLNKLINFTVSVISRMFFIFFYKLWAPLGKIKLNQFQPGEWCFLRLNHLYKTSNNWTMWTKVKITLSAVFGMAHKA